MKVDPLIIGLLMMNDLHVFGGASSLTPIEGSKSLTSVSKEKSCKEKTLEATHFKPTQCVIKSIKVLEAIAGEQMEEDKEEQDLKETPDIRDVKVFC